MESGLLVFLFLMFWCIGLKVCNTFSLVILKDFFNHHLWIISIISYDHIKFLMCFTQGWEYLSFDVQQRENSTPTPVPIVFYLQFKMASFVG